VDTSHTITHLASSTRAGPAAARFTVDRSYGRTVRGRDGGNVEEEARLVVHVQSPRVRRWVVPFTVAALLVGVVALASGDWLMVAAMVAAVVGPGFSCRQRAIIDEDGLTFDEVVRRRHVAWSELREVRLHWSWSGSRPSFDLVRHEGGDVAAAEFANLARHPRQQERTELIARLSRESERHGFGLDVREPTELHG
jgi:hypothetical protein